MFRNSLLKKMSERNITKDSEPPTIVFIILHLQPHTPICCELLSFHESEEK